jgi:hypothetical protein
LPIIFENEYIPTINPIKAGDGLMDLAKGLMMGSCENVSIKATITMKKIKYLILTLFLGIVHFTPL